MYNVMKSFLFFVGDQLLQR